MGEKENTFGVVFDSMELVSEEHLEMLLNTMDKETAIYLMIQGVKSAHSRGVFSLGECEILSKSIRVLSKKE